MVVPMHVHTQSDRATVEYAAFMWTTMRSLASHPGSLQLTVHCMGSVAAKRLTGMPSATCVVVPNIVPDQSLGGSMGHAACVEHALAMTGDGAVHVVVDADTVVLARGWDDYVRLTLGSGVGIVGTTYEDVGGYTSGTGNVQTYKGIPNVVWMALSPDHGWRALRALPQKGSDLVIADARMSRTYGLPVGHRVLRDVAWQLPEHLATNGISHLGWKQLKPSSGALVLQGLSDYHEEYHAEPGVPIVAHHRGSMRRPYRGDKVSQAFYAAVDAWLELEVARSPRWTSDDVDRPHEAPAAVWSPPTGGPTLQDTPGSWLKVTLDGRVVRPRGHDARAGVSITGDHQPGFLRLEGDAPGCEVRLSGAPIPYHVTVRNCTPGPAVVVGAGTIGTVAVPAGACWALVVDVDGVVRIS